LSKQTLFCEIPYRGKKNGNLYRIEVELTKLHRENFPMGIVAQIFQWYFPIVKQSNFMFVQGKFKFFLIDGLIGNPKKVCCGSHVSLNNLKLM
jgi:hypothetical protein